MKLINELREPGRQISNAGYPQASVYELHRGKDGGKYNEHQLEQSVSAVRSGLSTLLESA